MKQRSLLVLAAVIGLGAGLAFALRGGAPTGTAADETQLAAVQEQLTHTIVLPEDFRTVPEFTLQGTDGEALDASFLDEQWTLAFFGYTYCPDVCPITLQVMKEVVARLDSERHDPMQVAFFTVDPARDTAERMREYVGFFDEDFVGVTGELTPVLELTRSLGIVASFTAVDGQPDDYLVDHTASMLLIDPQRRVRAKFNAPHQIDSIVADYLVLRDALG